MSQHEIEKDLKQRTEILNALVKYNKRNLAQVGKIMHLYYTDKQELQKLLARKLNGI